MKSKLLILALVAVLTACSDGCETVTVTTVVATPVVAEPAPIAPEPVLVTELSPEPILACPQGTGCTTSPSLAPIRPIIIKQNSTPGCVRDESIALILVDGLLTDSCGNKYGATK
jgi:hypothetical protein